MLTTLLQRLRHLFRRFARRAGPAPLLLPPPSALRPARAVAAAAVEIPLKPRRPRP